MLGMALLAAGTKFPDCMMCTLAPKSRREILWADVFRPNPPRIQGSEGEANYKVYVH